MQDFELAVGNASVLSDNTMLDERGMLEDTLVVAVGEFGRSPQRGVSTSAPYGPGDVFDDNDTDKYVITQAGFSGLASALPIIRF